ncbi:MAG TPA: alpha/beta hydrolase [Gaiellaceae bacterium]|nr:alpha/beta hydrolase [Gaiellaceae bacterium]
MKRLMREVTTSDGRTLRVYEGGDPAGKPVFLHNGTPSGGLQYPPAADDARGRGIRLISYDRPGYAGSTSKPGRTVADAAADVATIADALGVDRFATWGISGGGPHSLACAALLSDRVVAAASLAGVAPIDAEGLDWTEGMGEENLEEFAATQAGQEALESFLEPRAKALGALGTQGLATMLQTLLTPVDAAVFTGDVAEYLSAAMASAIEERVDGWRDDDLAFDNPWGFAVEEIRVPVLLWHGEHDLFVPISHGRWLAERIPGVDARLSPDDGHITLGTRRVPEVHAWLLERF